MQDKAKNSVPKLKYKSFTYKTSLRWAENRAGTIGSGDKPPLRVASPPEFQGEEGVWSPEDLFVAAVESCTMTTFLAFAHRRNLSFVSYTSSAEGLLEFKDGSYQFTKIIVKPEVVIETAEDLQNAEKIMEQAHKYCLIANSIKTDVVIQPDITSVSDGSS